VTPVNDLPVVTDIPNQTVAEGETFTTISLDDFVSDVEDADADITWSWAGNTDLTVTIDGSRIATIGIPNASWYGNETITFTATDLEGGQGSDQATFRVTSVNDPPIVTDIPYQTIAEGESFATINLDDFVSDVEDADADITWTWSGNTDLTISIDGNRIATIGIPDENWNGNETIIFTATDLEGANDVDTATFIVNPVNDPPIVSDIPAQNIAEGEIFASIILDDFVIDTEDSIADIVFT